MKEHLKVIIDTNLWINYLITSRLVDLDSILRDGRIRLIFSAELISEFVEVSRRPRLRRYFSESSIETLLLRFEFYGIFAPVISEVNICRDPKDNFLLALAKDADADFLVTKDDDLLVLGTFGRTQILDYFGFMEAINV
ncbi:MAG: putative toxin-antitoxin system toxin component, PIN family [Phycisphaerae bacterium]|nr:putative toxin-antitoxin system toxin component, PIN family [Saprospiraceae bacterium]